MFELKRSKRIEEELKIGDEILKISLTPDDIAKDFHKRYNDIIKAEQFIKNNELEQGKFDNMDKALVSYGEAVLSLFSLVFGEENSKKIIEFYEDNYMEMSVEVFPFITEIISPKITKALEEQKNKLAEQYKGKQRRKLGL